MVVLLLLWLCIAQRFVVERVRNLEARVSATCVSELVPEHMFWDMEFSCAVTVMDKIGGGEKKKEDESQIGARFWSLHVGPYQSSVIAAAKGYE